jgi:putative membrane protein
MAHLILDDAARLRIRDAIASAEKTTSGEIFAVVARSADEYRFIPILWAMLAALFVPMPLLFAKIPSGWVSAAGSPWDQALDPIGLPLPATWIYLLQLIVFLVLAVVLSLPAIKPLLVPATVKRHHAHGLAVEQFLAHGLHITEARTGVLIFVSLFERYAEIVADAGINGKVDQAVWDELIAALLADIRAGRLDDGLVGAVTRAGVILAAHFPPRPPNRDELPNDLILL